MELQIESERAMGEFGEKLGKALTGSEVIELVGDVGAGKTTLVKGLARGLGIDEDVQSPTFTISRIYQTGDDSKLAHYDFYRLTEPGILQLEIQESVADTSSIVVIEWGDIVEGVLPKDRLTIRIEPSTQHARVLSLSAGGDQSRRLVELLQ
ncbi:MAG TPA: tRNA (adenosine(37)-N6)-threonylcarbamoyltransferase complex ATPase subunit type 1 TsaE [Patescibacteria group bacterium]|jgi:tRNA threonylcarbamoyladenosine biosynthesis protein TsaE|nr:tRNA (adenosine(37)-N6)-threonylcarbamoyltransferase complex ATPase subunit type 1 TsaE [Patescibacteria group bacterium]